MASDEAATIPQLLAARVADLGAEAVMVEDDTVLTYAELDARSRSLAARLVAAGVNRRTRVGLMAPNGIDWLVTAVAIVRVGAVVVPLSTLLRAPEVEAQLRTASVAVLLTVAEHRGRRYSDELDAHIDGLAASLDAGGRHARLPDLRRRWILDDIPTDPAPADLVDALSAGVRPADDLAILFTSGSRSTPKGVVHTHGGAIGATASGLAVRCIGRGERLYIPMPFFWMGGFGGGLLSVLVAGATLLTETDPTPATTIAFLERERATLFRGWPDQAARIAADPAFAAADLSSLRPGSLDAVLPPELRAPPDGRANLFGMTESFGPYCGTRLDTVLEPAHRGSCGQPFAGVEVRIVDPDSGAVQSSGERGAIEIRSPHLLRAICGRSREDTFRVDGFYATGDLGHVDADGYLFYAGRVDDMVKVRGATVYPSEVEAGLRTLDEVRLAFVTDVVGDDGRPAVGAAIVPARDVTVAELAAAARLVLSAFKVPTRWVLLASADEVPMLASGKVDKSGLQTLIAGNQ